MPDRVLKARVLINSVPNEVGLKGLLGGALPSVPFADSGGTTTWGDYIRGRAKAAENADISRLLGPNSGGIEFLAGSTTLASAAITDLGSVQTLKVAITGTATITSFGTAPHRVRFIRFMAAATLTHNATSLILPGSINIVTAPGDTAIATSDASGNWTARHYQRANGTPLALPVSALRASFRNRIRNGNFAINQRGLSGNVSLPAGAYGHDGWKSGAGGCTYSRSGAGANIASGSLLQVIEGGLYLPEGGTYTVSWSGTAQARVNGGAFSPSPIVVNGIAAGANVTVEFGTGTFGLVQVEPGSTATPYEYRDDEMQRCRRYYFQNGTSVAAGGGSLSEVSVAVVLPVPMRVTPTMTVSGSAQVLEPGIAVRSVSSAIYYGAENGGVVAAALATNMSGYYHPALLYAGGLIFSAEL